MKLSVLIKAALGCVALVLAAIGLFLPIWPTTPFVLVALGCFSAMPAMRAKILRIHFFRTYYESYTQGRGLPRKTVMASLLFLWGTLLVSALVAKSTPMMIVLAAVGVAVTIHICWMARTRQRRPPKAPRQIEKSE